MKTVRSRAGLALLCILLVAAITRLPAGGAESAVGAAGVDTSLPATDSEVTVRGRGPFSNLEVTINQTRNLVNQAVSISWTGAVPTTRGASRFAENYLQIFQCWGDPDGTIPENDGPPPEQCVAGASDAVYGGRNAGIFPAGGFALERIISRKDFANYDPKIGVLEEATGLVWRAFRAVDGTVVGPHYDPNFNPAVEGGNYWLNSFFNAITTNEIAGGRTSSNGTGAELFEVTTGLESTGLGCGQHVQPVPGGEPKIPRCWLVVVPRSTGAIENEGTPFRADQGVFTSPLSASAWRNRIAIPLEFTPIDSACDIGAEDRRIAGSELPVGAIASWQQALCAKPGVPPYTYGTVGDASARQQLASGVPGGPGMVIVSRALDPTTVSSANPVVYAPVSLSGIVIGFNVERIPRADVDPAEEALRGVRVADINLTPRLVAKLLTQSYRDQTAIKSTPTYEWVKTNPPHLGLDPDFLRFNPEFDLLQIGNGKNFGGLVMPARNSDTARQVWEWVFADPEAKAWLDGQPDEFGMKVNPIYASTAGANSTGTAFGDPVPELFPKSDPYCFQAPPQGTGGAVVPQLLCGTDWLPYTQSYRDAARLTRTADDGARTTEDPFALSSDKVYRPNGPQILGSRAMLSITDSASAAQYGLQMANLSRAGDDGPERRFLAPDTTGLLAGLKTFSAATSESPVRVPQARADVPDAYPLTALSVAAVAPLRLDAEAREDYATFLDYVAGDGQVNGYELGQLPVGYAPLPADLTEATAAAATAVRTLTAPPAPSGPTDPGPVVPGVPANNLGGVVDFGSPRASTRVTAPVVPIGAAPVASSVDLPDKVEGIIERLATPFTAVAASRFAVPVLGALALASGMGALEITKRRPRRWPGGVRSVLRRGQS